MIADRFVDSGHHGTSEESSSFLLTAFFFLFARVGSPKPASCSFFFLFDGFFSDITPSLLVFICFSSFSVLLY